MNDDQARREQLSALFDGELGASELRFALRAVDADPALAQRWSRLQLMRSALRREALLALGEARLAALRRRLDRERPGRSAAEWLKPLAGIGIAAGVAALALFATGPGVAPPETPVATGASAPIGVQSTGFSTRDITRPVAAQPVTERQLLPLAAPTLARPLDPRLEQYFLRHGSAVQGGARGGFVPYVYVVATPPANGAAGDAPR